MPRLSPIASDTCFWPLTAQILEHFKFTPEASEAYIKALARADTK